MQNVAGKSANIKGQSKRTVPLWLPNAAVVTIGGMLFTTLAQWLMQYCAVAWEEGHLVDPGMKRSMFFPLLLGGVFIFLLINGGFGYKSPKKSLPYYDSDNSGMTTVVLLTIIFGFMFCLLQIDVAIAVTIMGLSALGMFGLLALQFVYSEPKARTYAVLSWLLGYLAIWVFSATFSSVNIWIFIAAWVLFGALGGNTVTSALRKSFHQDRHEAGHTWRSTEQTPEKVQQSRRARMTSAVVSQYGRVPQDTFDLFNQHVRRVTGPVAASIPLGASEEKRNMTIREILNITLRDWRENDNLQGLQPVDVDDLRSFVDASMAIAGDANDPVSLAIYKITLRSLLQDWLDNWNVDGQPGPPLRRY